MSPHLLWTHYMIKGKVTSMRFIKKTIIDFFLFFVKILYRIRRKDFTEDDRHVWVQFLGFCIIGCSNFVVQYLVYSSCIEILGFNIQLANACGFVISVLNAFYWNNKLVFKGEKTAKEIFISLMKTYMAYAVTGLFLTAVLLHIEVEILHIPKLLAPVLNLFITTPINFFLNKLWAFGDKTGME